MVERVEQETGIRIDKYLNMLFRHKALLIIPFLLIGIGGAAITFLLPNMYQSSTLILVEPQKIPENYVQATITSGIESRLHTLKQQVMSRTRLQRIINEFELHKGIKGFRDVLKEKIPWIDKIFGFKGTEKNEKKTNIVGLMRKNIKIDVRNSGRRGSAISSYFSITYTGYDPQLVMDVTNKLASLFIEENLKIREVQVKGTTEFLERELESIKTALEQKELEVTKFREQYMGELPEQMQANLRIMDQLQMRLQTMNDSLRSAKDRSMLIQKQLNDIVFTVSNNNAGGDSSNEPATGVFSLETQLEQSNMQLSDLMARYTDKHPDMKKLKKSIENIEKKLETNKNKIKEDPTDTLTSELQVPTAANDPLYRSLTTQLESAKLEITSLTKEKRKLESKLRKFQSRIEKIPNREQQLIKLTRDYDIMKESYQSLFESKLQAKLSENLEKKQKGERFSILDPAYLPERPDEPNRPKLILLSFMAGLSVGIGLIWLVECLDNTIYDVDEIEAFTNLSVLAVIPKIDNI